MFCYAGTYDFKYFDTHVFSTKRFVEYQTIQFNFCLTNNYNKYDY